MQNQYLGCGATTPCSLVVVPSQGGDSLDFASPVCSNHTVDVGGTDRASTPSATSPARRSRLTALLVGEADRRSRCTLRPRRPAARCVRRLQRGGSPMLADAMQQWETGLCFGSAPSRCSTTGRSTKARRRNYFPAGTEDVAFTTLPMTGTNTRTSLRVRAGRRVGRVGRLLGGQPEHRPAVHEHQAGRPGCWPRC